MLAIVGSFVSEIGVLIRSLEMNSWSIDSYQLISASRELDYSTTILVH